MTNRKRDGNFYGRFNPNPDRAAAIERGDKTYTSRAPCERGHFVFFVSGYNCVECRNAAQRASWARRYATPESKRRRSEAMTSEQKRAAIDRQARWRKANPERYRALQQEREAAMRTQTPSWADRDAMKKFYENRPEGHEVDHIVPLQGKIVSGLHVLCNLQYLPAEENRKKNRTFEVRDE